MEALVVEATLREGRGKGAARRIRQTGLIPAVLYGGQREAVALTVNAKQVAQILRSETGHNTIFTLRVKGGSEEKALVKDWQADPVRGSLLHVDLLRVAMDVRMRVKVPVHPVGEPQGVKLQGGIFEMVTREVEVECLPEDIPEEFKMDVSELLIGKQLRAGDIQLPERVRLVSDPQRVLAHVVALKKEEEVVAPEVAAVTEAAAAEPEVIKKGKKEAEEGEEVEAAEAPKEAKERKESKEKEKEK
jgi:large subunit ribosomal protein L25